MKIIAYELAIVPEQTIEMPQYCLTLCVQLEYNKIIMWVHGDESKELVPRTFVMYSSGDEIDKRDYYVGTVQSLPVKHTYHIHERFEPITTKKVSP